MMINQPGYNCQLNSLLCYHPQVNGYDMISLGNYGQFINVYGLQLFCLFIGIFILTKIVIVPIIKLVIMRVRQELFQRWIMPQLPGTYPTEQKDIYNYK